MSKTYQTTVAGVLFFGQEKVAGTERGVDYTFSDAARVFEALAEEKKESGGESKLISF